MSENPSIREFLGQELEEQHNAWYDFFCKRESIPNKTKKLVGKLRGVLKSPRVNQDTMYVFFKNNCPGSGSLYDDFRICDLETGNVIYTIIPWSGYNDNDKGAAVIWGRENEFEKPLFTGTWKGAKEWFNDPSTMPVDRTLETMMGETMIGTVG